MTAAQEAGVLREEGDMRYSRALPFAVLPLVACLASFSASTQDCDVNANPACSSALNLGVISGDTGTPQLQQTGTGERFFLVRLREDSSSQRDLTARIDLAVPAGMDYDLHVRCHSCSGITRSSTGDGSLTETIGVRRTEKALSTTDDSFNIIIEVRHRCGTNCAPWSLRIIGNAAHDAAAIICN